MDPAEEVKKARGCRLREAREGRRWSQKALAARVSFSAAYIGQFELGDRTGNPEQWLELSRALGVSVGWLMFGEGDSTATPSVPLDEGVHEDGVVDAMVAADLLGRHMDRARTDYVGVARKMAVAGAAPGWFGLEVKDVHESTELRVGDIIVMRPGADAAEHQLVLAGSVDEAENRIAIYRVVDGAPVLWPVAKRGPLIHLGDGDWRILAVAVELRRPLDPRERRIASVTD